MTQPWTLLAGGARMGVGRSRGHAPGRLRVAAGQRAGARLALDALDALLASTTAEVATDRVLASPWTDGEQGADGLARRGRRARHRGGRRARAGARPGAGHRGARPHRRSRRGGRRGPPARRARARRRHVEQAAERVLAGPELERLVRAHGREPSGRARGRERVREQVLDQVVDRLLASPERGRSSTRSPAARRSPRPSRTRASVSPTRWRVRCATAPGADAVVERTTRRLLRRRPRMDPPTGPLPLGPREHRSDD